MLFRFISSTWKAGGGIEPRLLLQSFEFKTSETEELLSAKSPDNAELITIYLYTCWLKTVV